MKTLIHGVLSIGASAVLLAGCALRPVQDDTEPSISGRTTSQEALIYAVGGTSVQIYNYPSLTLDTSFTLGYDGISSCSDSQGDVYLGGNFGNRATTSEYAYGATSASATVSAERGYPSACAADSTTGDFAMGVDWQLYKGFRYVVVYPHFHGRGIKYTYPKVTMAVSLSYDGGGNLFLLGRENCNVKCRFHLAELPKGGTAFEPITMHLELLGDLGEIQWDGKYLAVGACPNSDIHLGCRTPFKIYRLRVSGSQAKVTDSIAFDGLEPAGTVFRYPDTSLQPSLGILVAAKPSSGGFSTWEYPGGGQVYGQTDQGAFRTVTVAVPGSDSRAR